MEFSRPPHLEPIIERIRGFVQRELVPLEPTFLNGDFRAMLPQLAEKRRQVKQLGLWAP